MLTFKYAHIYTVRTVRENAREEVTGRGNDKKELDVFDSLNPLDTHHTMSFIYSFNERSDGLLCFLIHIGIKKMRTKHTQKFHRMR